MKSFAGRIAVITGGGTGMGRELARQLTNEGCHVAMCDVSEESMAQTQALCERAAPRGTRVSTTLADVSDEAQVLAFRDAVARDHRTDHIHLLFNNAGIGAAGSFLRDERDEWEKTFDVCWYGVYYCSRAFVPMLVKSPEGHLINTSSVNGFWATLGPTTAHTSYSTAKFAVKGFTEALINDFRMNAPHVKVSLVMPGHIGTSIIINSARILGRDPKEMSDDQLEEARQSIIRLGFDVSGATNDEIRQMMLLRAEMFRDQAPMSAAQAAKVILDGVREDRWRILVGEDAHILDRMVREAPEEAYEPSFMERFVATSGWKLTPQSDASGS
jgi:NAD(P)-dependent dehydrogenase (short-subunit alcohol dehydrogenase family)